MAILPNGVDGFGLYGTTTSLLTQGKWAEVTSGTSGSSTYWNLSTSNPRTGTYHLRLGPAPFNVIPPSYVALRQVFPTGLTTVGLSYAINFSSLPDKMGVNSGSISNNGTMILADFRDITNTSQSAFVLNTDGSISLYRNLLYSNGVFVAGAGPLALTSPGVIVPGAYQMVEFLLVISDTVGQATIHIDEVEVMNTAANLDTKGTANTTTTQVLTGSMGNSSSPLPNGSTIDLADWIPWDTTGSAPNNTFLGRRFVGTQLPTGDTATAQWTPSTGSTQYGVIDEVPPNDATDYLTAATSGLKTIVDVQDLPINTGVINTVIPVARFKEASAGTCNVQSGMNSAGSETLGTTTPATTSYTYWSPTAIDNDPDTGVAWIKAGFDAAGLVLYRDA